jgi:hypothetical protein
MHTLSFRYSPTNIQLILISYLAENKKKTIFNIINIFKGLALFTFNLILCALLCYH